MKERVFQSNGRRYSLNKPALFTPYGHGSELFKGGVHRLEQGCFAWTKGSSFDWELCLDEEEDLVVQMDFWKIYHGVQRLVVLANEKNVFHGTVRFPSVRFRIPRECMDHGHVKVSMIYPDATSPVQHKEGNDSRILAFGLRQVMVMDEKRAVGELE